MDFTQFSDDLARVAIDPMTSMLNGGGTSLFGDGDVEAGCWKYPEDLVPAPPMPDVAGIASKISQMLISDVAEFAGTYIGDNIGDLMTPPDLGSIMSLGAQEMQKYIKKPGEIMKELISTQEEVHDQYEEESIAKGISEQTEQMNSSIADVKDKVSYTVSNIKGWAGKISSYIGNGPAWVESECKKMVNMAHGEIEKQVGPRFDHLKDKKKQFTETMAQEWAKKQANKVNELVTEQTNDKLKKPKQLVAKAKNVAKGAAKDALLNLKATLGL